MLNIWGKVFLSCVILTAIKPAIVHAYSYEDYLPPGSAEADNSGPPPTINAQTYQASSSQPVVTADPAVHAPVSHAGAAPSPPYQAQSYQAQPYQSQAQNSSYPAEGMPAGTVPPADNTRGQGSWYVSANAAASQRPSASGPAVISAITSSGIAVVGTGTEAIDFAAGPSFGVATGYRLSPYFRIEGEVSYSSYGVRDVRPTVSPSIEGLNGSTFRTVSGGDLRRAAFLLNGYFDLRGYGPFVPFVGGGLGYGHLFGTTNVSVNSAGTPFITTISDADTGIGMLEAGFGYEISDHWSIAPSYRYLHYFADGGGLGDETAQIFKMVASYDF